MSDARLVDRIIKLYMNSNGMAELVEEDRQELKQRVAALKLAVHLFKEPFKTETPSEMVKLQK
jgi:hypothetical protein